MKKNISIFALIIIFMASLFTIPAFAAKVDPDSVYDDVAAIKIMDKTDVFNLQAKGAVLMDAATGSVLHEKNSHEKLPIASVTKVMSMLLIMEAVDSGRISMQDMVPISEYASGMGGSQAYIEAGEQFSVNEMMKAIAIHSSNDVTVAMGEYISGSEELFVAAMNDKAKELGMQDTNFLDCTGLTDDGHFSSAYDVALMSRELITKHPKVLEYTSTWRDTFRNGTFDLDNTNKLIHYYKGVDGLKTGFTNKAGFCLSATIKKNDMRVISVVLGEPNSNTRFAETRKLLDYAFANFENSKVSGKGEVINTIEVKKGLQMKVTGILSADVNLLLKKGEKSKIEREITLKKSLMAPVAEGQKIGEAIYKVDDKEVGKADVVAQTKVEKATFMRLFTRLMGSWFGLGRG